MGVISNIATASRCLVLSIVVLLFFLPVIIIHCYCTKSALTQFGFCNHYVIHVNELSFSMLAA